MDARKRKAEPDTGSAKLRRTDDVVQAKASAGLRGKDADTRFDDEDHLGPGGPVAEQFWLPAHQSLPRLAVYEIMSRHLPQRTGVEGEALDMVRRGGAEFVALLSARARNVASERRGEGAEMMGADIVLAASQLGYTGVARVLDGMLAPQRSARVARALALHSVCGQQPAAHEGVQETDGAEAGGL